jgi:hypothetical protein
MVPLSEEPPRMDYLLLRKQPASEADTSAETLRGLWSLLPQVSVVEYKSPGRPYRTGDLDRLWSYVHAYYADLQRRPARRGDLCAALAVAGRTPSLDDDVADMGLRWDDLGGGYWRIAGGIFALYVVEIVAVATAEGDGVLHSLGSGKLTTPEARWFWTELVGTQEAGMSMQDLEGYDELLAKVLEKLPAERRLAGLDRDHQALAFPVEVLRLLPEEYVRSLSTEVQAEIRRRIGQAGH